MVENAPKRRSLTRFFFKWWALFWVAGLVCAFFAETRYFVLGFLTVVLVYFSLFVCDYISFVKQYRRAHIRRRGS